MSKLGLKRVKLSERFSQESGKHFVQRVFTVVCTRIKNCLRRYVTVYGPEVLSHLILSDFFLFFQ